MERDERTWFLGWALELVLCMGVESDNRKSCCCSLESGAVVAIRGPGPSAYRGVFGPPAYLPIKSGAYIELAAFYTKIDSGESAQTRDRPYTARKPASPQSLHSAHLGQISVVRRSRSTSEISSGKSQALYSAGSSALAGESNVGKAAGVIRADTRGGLAPGDNACMQRVDGTSAVPVAVCCTRTAPRR